LEEPRKGTFQIPIIVRCLKDKIAEWHSVGGVIQVLPKNASFDVLNIRTSRPLAALFEYMETFECAVKITSEENMNERGIKLYQRLKGMECELTQTGVLRKNWLFKFLPQPPDVKMDDRLIKALSSDHDFLSMIRGLKPDELSISLFYRAPFDVYTSPSKEKLFASMAEYYQNPKEIAWIITASKVIPRFATYGKVVIKIYNLLEYVSQRVRKVTEETELNETSTR